MAYAAVVSLKNTFGHLLNSSRILLVPPSPKVIEFAYEELKSLQEILKRLDSSSKGRSRKKVNALDRQIREAVSKFEDVLESHVANQILSQSESHPLVFSIDLQDLRQGVDSFTETLKKMEEEYIKELDNRLRMLEDDDAAAVSSSIGFGGKKSKLVGISNVLSEITYQLTHRRYAGFPVFSLVGMAGIGKSTLAKEVYEDPNVLEYFDCRVWVTVGRKYELNEIARGILSQVDKMLTVRDEETVEYLCESLKGKTYFIVLDDVWDTQLWDYLRSCFPDNDDIRGRIMLTTRLREVAEHTKISAFGNLKIMQLLEKDASWDLLREKVFGEDQLCPPQLEKAGKKIAENCEGLPLMIVTVADLLSKAEKTPEYWNMVAEKKNSSIFMAAYDQISEVLFPSYEYLPQHLKPCFLHMGVFPQEYEIPRSKLINMWIVEGFIEPNMSQTLKHCAKKYLVELVSNNVVIVHRQSTVLSRSVKTCRLHSSLWHLCNIEAGKNKFFHVLNTCADGLVEGMNSQRRLCIHNNMLFGMKDVHSPMGDNCAFTARSLLCFGAYHKYPVPICFELRLLRVLDALKIRFYVFPMEVLKLVQLRYLAFTYNGKLPASISKLLNLRFLIIHRHLNIKLSEAPSYVPIEIWDMEELRHIQIVGSNIPNSTCGASLKNLSTLLDVSSHSCTKGVLERIPNLRKLGIQIELAPEDGSIPLSCFDHISHLNKLKSLKCIVVNPELRFEVVAPPPPPMFPSNLRKLHLGGFCYPWEYMNIIGSLPKLEVLKLQCYAFQGPNWEVEGFKFRKLKFLTIEDTDLVQWKVEIGGFPRLRYLSIKHCYKLEEFDWEFDYYFKKVEIVDSNPLAVAFINQIRSRRGRTFLDVCFHSSWDDGRLKQ